MEMNWAKRTYHYLRYFNKNIQNRSHSEVFLEKDILKICSKFTGEQPCQGTISKKKQSNFVEITLRYRCSLVNLVHIFRTSFLKNTSGWLLLIFETIVVYS